MSSTGKIDLYLKSAPRNAALVRTGTNNSDLAILKDPSIHPQMIQPIDVSDMDNNVPSVGHALALELKSKQVNARRKIFGNNNQTISLLHSDDFQRTSLLKM